MKTDTSLWSTLLTKSGLPKAPVFPFSLSTATVIPLDLSVQNQHLSQINLIHTASFASYIFTEIERAGAVAAVGGYNEERSIYARSNHFSGDEPRNIHLGIDIWTAAGTSLFAPIPGRVHSFRDNANFGDYGPTLILEHLMGENTLYTLYGHLSKKSLQPLYKGKVFNAGDLIGTIGPYPENGDWPPHLHIQVIIDMLGMQGDFPGVVAPSQRDFYLGICPDPTFLLDLP